MGIVIDKLTKLQSRLRNVTNGNSEVNFMRAALNGAVKVGRAKPDDITRLRRLSRPRLPRRRSRARGQR